MERSKWISEMEVDLIRLGDQLIGWRCFEREVKIILVFWSRHWVGIAAVVLTFTEISRFGVGLQIINSFLDRVSLRYL